MAQFYLTVSSDSGCHFQDSNSISRFKVHLGRVIELTGEWEVALFEISFPETFENVRDGACIIHKENIGELPNSPVLLRVKSEHVIPNGFYHTTETFCNALNDITGDILHFEVNDDKNNKTSVYANVVALAKEKVLYTFSANLSDILGFRRDIVIANNKTTESEVACDLRKGMPLSLNVFSDIIPDQLVNNTHDKLLREVHLKPEKFKYGFQQHRNFERLVFLPVIKKNLEYLEFHIKDEQGREISFSHGTLKLVLLFRRAGNGF